MNVGLRKKNSLLSHLKQYYPLYLFLIPGLVHLFIFRYRPMGGLVIVFQNFSVTRGFANSPWVGFANFQHLFSSIAFLRVLRNSLTNSILLLVWAFPVPIILSIMLNEMRRQTYKRVLQTVLYLPHFISWVVVISMTAGFLGMSAGSIVNDLIVRAGGERISFLTEPRYFRPILVGSSIWRGAGWGTIVYLAALAGVDPELYEAALVDGANRLQRIWYITLPTIASVIVVILILNLGNLMSNSFEHIWLLQNNLNRNVSETLETYSYQVGLRENRFSFAAAVGMFQSVVECGLIFTANYLARKIRGQGLW